MKAKSLLLTILVPVSGLTFLSLPAGAECWMTCPPGSTTTPSATEQTGVTATAEPVSPEELTPAKTPETTAKASPAPAKPKAAPIPAEATVEPVASPEELTPAKTPEATAKASPAQVPAKASSDPRWGKFCGRTFTRSIRDASARADANSGRGCITSTDSATLWRQRSVPIGPGSRSGTSPRFHPRPGARHVDDARHTRIIEKAVAAHNLRSCFVAAEACEQKAIASLQSRQLRRLRLHQRQRLHQAVLRRKSRQRHRDPRQPKPHSHLSPARQQQRAPPYSSEFPPKRKLSAAISNGW